MLSGVGDAKELKSHGIAVVKDLPEVGKNLQDHHLLFGNHVRFSSSQHDSDMFLNRLLSSSW